MSSDLELDHPLWMTATPVPVALEILRKCFLLPNRLALRGFAGCLKEVAQRYKVIFSAQTIDMMYYFHTFNKPVAQAYLDHLQHLPAMRPAMMRKARTIWIAILRIITA